MSEIKDITYMEFNDLLQHVELGELDKVKSRMDRTCRWNCCALSGLVLHGDGIPTMGDARNLIRERTHAKCSPLSLPIQTKIITDGPRFEVGPV